MTGGLSRLELAKVLHCGGEHADDREVVIPI